MVSICRLLMRKSIRTTKQTGNYVISANIICNYRLAKCVLSVTYVTMLFLHYFQIVLLHLSGLVMIKLADVFVVLTLVMTVQLLLVQHLMTAVLL